MRTGPFQLGLLSLAFGLALFAVAPSPARAQADTTQGVHGLTVNFTGFTPHVGRMFALRVVKVDSVLADTTITDTLLIDSLTTALTVADTAITVLGSAEFTVMFDSLLADGASYRVQFWADLNANLRYDSPPADHAWQLALMDVTADTMLTFAHNTQFTDIRWFGVTDTTGGDTTAAAGTLTIQFTGMTPHLGQRFALRVVEADTMAAELVTVADTIITALDSADFTLMFDSILVATADYWVQFYADYNNSGRYDSPPVDHAWQLELMDVMGDTTLMFAHNTNFTDIMYPDTMGAPTDTLAMHNLTMSFTGFAPHVGQMFALRVVKVDSVLADTMVTDTLLIDSLTTAMTVADTVLTALGSADFTLTFDSLLADGASYRVQFWADLNNNVRYDSPPVDHAWQLALMDVMADTTVAFGHNTDFTDIRWFGVTDTTGEDTTGAVKYGLMVSFTGMADAVGHRFALRVVPADTMMADTTAMDTSMAVADTVIGALDGADFSVMFDSVLTADMSYWVQFYADTNGNNRYDAPPTDLAWQLPLLGVMGDTTLSFAFDTTFTDINYPDTVGGPFSLTLDLMGLEAGVGYMLGVRVVDLLSQLPVADTLISSLEGSSAMLTFEAALLPMAGYRVDIWSDINGNSLYDAPPTDQAWRLWLSMVSADTMLQFTANTQYTDVMFPVSPPVSCTCDINGDGILSIADAVTMIRHWFSDSTYACLDRSGDGRVAINDVVLLIINIRNQVCPEQGVTTSLAAATGGNPLTRMAIVTGLSPELVEFLDQVMPQLGLTAEEQAAYQFAIHGDAGRATLPQAFALGQNTPNPFNPSTTIGYSVPEGRSAHVRLMIYDLRGRLVRTLVDEDREAGSYNVFWDGADAQGRRVASGVYFYRLQAGDFNQVRKMILLK